MMVVVKNFLLDYPKKNTRVLGVGGGGVGGESGKKINVIFIVVVISLIEKLIFFTKFVKSWPYLYISSIGCFVKNLLKSFFLQYQILKLESESQSFAHQNVLHLKIIVQSGFDF